MRDIGIETAMYSRVLFAALGLVAAVGTAIVYFVGGNLAISGTIGVGTIATFAVYVSQIYQPLTQLANARVDVLTALVSFERVFEVLDFPPLITDRADALDLVAAHAGDTAGAGIAAGTVTFDHVWFRHPSAAVTSIRSLEEVSGATDLDGDGARGSCTTSRSPPRPASWWRWSGRRGRARPPLRCSSPASTTPAPGGCASTATTSATSRSSRSATPWAW